MSATSQISKSHASTLSTRSELLRQRLTKWSKQPTVIRAEGPTNLTSARRLGYKATKSFVIARVKLLKGRRVRDRPTIGRKPGRNQKRVSPSQSREVLAMQKAAKKFPNLKPLNAYFVGMNGVNAFYEVILHN